MALFSTQSLDEQETLSQTITSPICNSLPDVIRVVAAGPAWQPHAVPRVQSRHAAASHLCWKRCAHRMIASS